MGWASGRRGPRGGSLGGGNGDKGGVIRGAKGRKENPPILAEENRVEVGLLLFFRR